MIKIRRRGLDRKTGNVVIAKRPTLAFRHTFLEQLYIALSKLTKLTLRNPYLATTYILGS